MRATFNCTSPAGVIEIPGSKSFSQRLVLLSTLLSIPLTLENISYSGDELRAISVASQCGMSTTNSSHNCMISGTYRSPKEIFVGESATLFRLAIGGLAGKKELVNFRLSESLMKRKHAELMEVLTSMGASFTPQSKGYLMNATHARGGPVEIAGRVSSQFISSLIVMKAIMNDFGSTVSVVDGLSSAGYVDITLETLKMYGYAVKEEGSSYSIESFNPVESLTCRLEGDFSSASYFMVLGSLCSEDGIVLKGLQKNSLQPDKRMVDFLKDSGADITVNGDSITARKSSLNGGDFDVDSCPDLALPLAVAAIFSSGKTLIHGVSRLRYKEADRIESIQELVAAFGGEASLSENTITIIPPENPVASHEVSFTEHRSVMAGVIASICSGSPVINNNLERISKSFPGFMPSLKRLGCEPGAC